MHLHRPTLRVTAAALAAMIAGIYYLIGLGVIHIGTSAGPPVELFTFGVAAGSGFLIGTILLLAFDWRVLWILGAILQVLVAVTYFTIAPQRTPNFETWGVTLRVLQLPLFFLLVWLAWAPPEPKPTEPKPKRTEQDRR